jgi:beta-lactamase regulating signal transducer with metallopeptidase domain
MADVTDLFWLLLLIIPVLVLYVNNRARNRRDREEVRKIEEEIRDVKYQDQEDE